MQVSLLSPNCRDRRLESRALDSRHAVGDHADIVIRHECEVFERCVSATTAVLPRHDQGIRHSQGTDGLDLVA